MNICQNEYFLDQLKRHEGRKLNAEKRHVTYICPAGKLTIGYGHNLEANPIPDLHNGSTISEARATAILREDCSKFAMQLDRHIPWWRQLEESRAGVLLNMAFNMGVYAVDKRGKVRGLMSFKRFLVAVQESRWEDARMEMLDSAWAAQVGRRAVELARQMRTGKWQNGIEEVGVDEE